MSKAKIVWIAVIVTLLLVIIGRFVLAKTLLSWSGQDLQANIIDTDVSDDGLPDSQDFQDDNTLWWDQTIDPLDTKSDIYSGTLDIAIPYWLDEAAVQWLTDQINLDDKNNITLDLSQAKNKAEYTDRLVTRTDEFDIMLAPSSLFESMQDDVLNLPFQANIISSFHPSVWDLVETNNFSFLPFGLDPIITYSSEAITDQELTREDIDRYILTHPSQDQIGLW